MKENLDKQLEKIIADTFKVHGDEIFDFDNVGVSFLAYAEKLQLEAEGNLTVH